jgi:uncharacterized protein YdeI (YjbR/CyaY-like superfamily)
MEIGRTLYVKDRVKWRAWLQKHHDKKSEIWLITYKKHTGKPSLPYDDAVEEALCFGWIDSQRKRLDEHWYLQRYSRRRRGSPWSRVNVERVEALTAAGRMRPAGLAEVERAKADGRWDAAYDSPAAASVPEDLARALDEAGLSEEFAGLDSRNRYAILHRLQTARKPETRARRIEKYVNMLAAGEGPYP